MKSRLVQQYTRAGASLAAGSSPVAPESRVLQCWRISGRLRAQAPLRHRSLAATPAARLRGQLAAGAAWAAGRPLRTDALQDLGMLQDATKL